MATRGRKPTPAPAAEILDAVGEQQTAQAMAVMRQSAVSDETAIRAEVYRLGQLVGARQMALTAANFLRAADIQLFDEIAKSKGYKHIPILHPDGNLRPAENISEFCRLVFRKSYSALAETRQAIETLGAECFELATDIGLPRAQLRLMFGLGEDERQAVEKAMRDGGKDEVVTLIQSLANKLDETRAEVDGLKADLQDARERSAEKSQQIEQLKDDLLRIRRLPPDEVQAKLQTESTAILKDAQGCIRGELRQALIALRDQGETHGKAPIAFMAGLVSQLTEDLRALRDEFGLPEVSAAEHGWIDAE